MPTLIIGYSDVLCQFLLPLLTGLSAPQRRHIWNVTHALVISISKHKVLAALTRTLRVKHADEYALADFFRVSAWELAPLRTELLKVVVQCAMQVHALAKGAVFISIDDSLCVKTRAAEALQATTFYYDHLKERRQYKHLSRAARVVAMLLHVGPLVFPLACRLYLKRAQIPSLNRSLPEGQPKLSYQATHQLVYAMLDEVHALLPSGVRVYVLCDAWYASTDLFKHLRAYGWGFIVASKSDRRVGRWVLSQWWKHLGHQRVDYVHTHTTKGSRVYATRRVVGRLRRYPDQVLAVLSHSARRGSYPVYFICSNCTLSAATVLKYYAHRWQIEVTFAFLKERLGWDDFRLQSVTSTERWLALVWVAMAFLAVRRAQLWLQQPTPLPPAYQDVIDEQQRFQWRSLVHLIYQRAQAGVPEPVLLAELNLT